MNYKKNNQPPVKRTTFQQHKEEIEAKKRKENEETAQVYADFIADFGEEEENNSIKPSNNSDPKPSPFVKAFVKSSTSTSSHSNKNEITTSQSQIYQPKILETITTKSPQLKNTHNLDGNINQPSSVINQGNKKKKNLDSFLEELKKEQQEREFRAKVQQHISKNIKLPDTFSNSQSKAFSDTPDTNSTNLYVGNISPQVNETLLMETFGKYGPIASVKIMWPRTPEESDRHHNSGFVCFMKRVDAVEALSKLDSSDLMGLNLRIGWGKSVQLPSIPLYDPNQPKAHISTNLPFNAVPTPDRKTHVQIGIPSDSDQLNIIHQTIERVLTMGTPFELLLIERKSSDPRFTFLTDFTSPNHIYYRWKLFSLLQGDSLDEWRIKPFQMYENGPEFLPPPLPVPEPTIDETSDLDSEGNEIPGTSKGQLLSGKSKKYLKMINELTLDRDCIGNVMVFLVDHADAADETTSALCDLLISEKTDPNHKLALLYLISDTLHNISLEVSGSWKLRSKFETLLPTIFIHLHTVHKGIQAFGRLKAEAYRKRVMMVIPGWELMTFFPQPFLDHLTNLFQHGENYEQTLSSNQPHVSSESNQLKASATSNDEDLDGAPLKSSDDESVDGVPFADDDDIDGIAYNSDD